ncbi:MAG: pdxH [Rickettsiaceae bacterium]|jgi:pyridoxamine 5'-phosphate oxidase|nr:pdxH [Rickettsiaceae bacterium]
MDISMSEQVKSPIALFKEWYDKAIVLNVSEPTAMTLATATSDGIPSARIVLLKAYDERGFCFYTNFNSRKGKELLENPYAALCFYWDELGRQVRIEGKVEKVSEQEADAYFNSRSRGSQLGAWASKQSQPMEDEMDLPNRVKKITEQFSEGVIERPPFWHGFRVIPNKIEFWENKEFRLHRRLVYTKAGNGWKTGILYP